MNAYQLVDIVGKLSAFAGLGVAACAFMLPNGWRSPLGLAALLLGAVVLLGSVTHDPRTKLTWNQTIALKAIGR